jgi:hypothetical protein
MAAALKIESLQNDLSNEAAERAALASAVPGSLSWMMLAAAAMGPISYQCSRPSAFPVQSAFSVQLADDVHGWLLEQAAALRDRSYFSLDFENLAEELEAMAAQQRREIKKHLKKLLLHLLKFKTKPDEMNRHHSWRKSVREAREDISDLLADSPGIFQGKVDEFIATCYERACLDAGEDTGFPRDTFPKECPWSLDEMMNPDFFPSISFSLPESNS